MHSRCTSAPDTELRITINSSLSLIHIIMQCIKQIPRLKYSSFKMYINYYVGREKFKFKLRTHNICVL